MEQLMVNFVRKRVCREQFILNAVREKNVLDIGCVALDELMELHKKICQHARSCVGLDIVNAEGVIHGDAQDFDFQGAFDVLVAGEVIEHLADLRGFLYSSAKSLRLGGRLIITTPNAYSLIALKNAVFGQKVPNNPGHVILFDLTTIQNLISNYASDEFAGECFYYEEGQPKPLLYKMNKLISRIVIGYSCGILVDLIRVR